MLPGEVLTDEYLREVLSTPFSGGFTLGDYWEALSMGDPRVYLLSEIEHRTNLGWSLCAKDIGECLASDLEKVLQVFPYGNPR
jgi:hypothetical protein